MTRHGPKDRKFDNLVRIVRWRAAEARPGPAYSFLANGEVEAEQLSFADLDLRARAIGARLQQLGLKGERVLLLYPPGLGFVEAFFGCLYAGAVAVPAYPPRPHRADPRLRAIAGDAGPRAALTTSSLLAGTAAERLAGELAGLELLATDAMEPGLAEDWREPELGGDSLAFLQYTSGSTGDPKGVKVSHGNLLANEEVIRRAFRQDAESVIVGWLPVYHDMGLIGNVLQSLYVGARCILMSPLAFLQQPRRWLAAIGTYRATTSGGPNFAYDLCLRKVTDGQLEGLDLRSWRLAFNGAEPIRPETLDAFSRRFAPAGFRATAFYPCYGLAEATLFVSGGAAGTLPTVRAFEKAGLEANRAVAGRPGDAACRSLAGCGTPAAGHRVVVVDLETRTACPDGRIGEVWVAGPSVAHGYWNRPAVTAETFGGRLHEDPEPCLRTGDLGFLSGGELFLTGRLKDLIILRGRNHHPQDLESTAAASHPALRAGGVAAFAVEGAAGEELVLVCEVERGREPAAVAAGEAVRRAVAEEHEVEPREVILTLPGEVPKTSSGKLRRGACRTAYLAGDLRILARLDSQTVADEGSPERPARLPEDTDGLAGPSPAARRELLATLCETVARAARIPVRRIDPGEPLMALGLDSLRLVEVQRGLEEAFGISLPLADLLEADSLSDLADLLLARPAAPGPPASDYPFPSRATGEPPLSLGQEALWFLDRLAPGNPAYLLAGAALLREPLPEAELRGAFAALLARHAPLRTTLAAGPAGPVQRIRPAEPLPEGWFAEADATAWSEDDLRARLAAEAGRPFDLERDLPIRIRSYRTRSGEQVVLLVLHHVAADLWSVGVLVDELGSLLGQTGWPVGLPPLPLGYVDYVHGQRARLAGPEGERLWNYWRGEIGGDLPVLDLPLDRPRPPVQTFAGAERLLRLGRETGERVLSLAARQRSTPYVVLLSAFSALLWRYGGGDDLLVGSPAAGRRAAGLAGLVGYFVNPLVLRVRVPGDPSFAALAAAARRTVLSGLDHQDYPFPLLVERLQPERDPARPPLFQVLFALHETPHGGAELGAFALGVEGVETTLGGRAASPLRVERRGALCDLSLYVAWVGGELVAALEYNTDLRDGATAERLLRHFATLVEGVTGEADARLSQLPLLTREERGQLLGPWSGSGVEEARPGGGLHELFEAQADRSPEAEALISGEERVSYGELEARANRLARHLASQGVGLEVLVGISLPRSARLVVAVLAVLKAGGAYLPLDPAYPAERRAYQLADSGARILVREGTSGTDPAGAACARVDLDVIAETLAAADSARLPGRTFPGQLAYVLYTSGSTGRPKGVAVEHRSAVALLGWAAGHFGAGELSGVLASTSLGFDLSVFELFLPLTRGGRVILADDLLALPALPTAGEVTLVNTVPSAVRELLRSGGLPGGVRTVTLAGEPLPGELAQELHDQPGVERVLNLYGPTEDTTYSTWEEVDRGARREPGIGIPIAGTRVSVVDPRLELVPVSVAGELLLGGAGLARGYLGRPALTAERFVPDPFSGRPGARLYRTGDLVRWRPEGGLAFLGRIDDQVKVRGFRVEPAEVEAALALHPGVGECAVVARDDGSGARFLAACVVPSGDAVPEGTGLRRFLAERLPAYLVPSAYELLPALPRTPSGKIDRAALARRRSGRQLRGPADSVPGGPTEELLAGVWTDLLGLEQVRAQDDFFALGGHSLLATRLISRLRDTFRVELALADVFRHPTLAGLAAHLDALRSAALPAAPPLLRAPRPPRLAPSPAQRRLWFLDRLAGGEPVYNMAGGFDVEGTLDSAALASAFAEVVRRHEALRTRFPTVDGEPMQEIVAALAVGLPVVDLGGLAAATAAAEQAQLARAEARRPFDLAAGPLIRLCLLRRGEERQTVLLTLHHVVADGWSLRVLAREIEALYDAFSRGLPSPLQELPLQYADFCEWQSRWLAGGLLSTGLAAWRERLAAAPPASELPGDRPRPAVQSFRGAVLPFAWRGGLGRDLAALARAESTTPFLLVLAGLAAVLHRLGGQEDLVLGAPFANRDRSEVEPLIGLFVNTLPLRLDLAGDPSFRRLLERAKNVTLDAHAHRHLPFEQLVEAWTPARDLSRSPLFQILLVADEDGAGRTPRLAGLGTAPVATPTGTAKFDLTLTIARHPGGLAGELEYASDLFDGATVERFAGHLGTLLAAAVEDPLQPLGTLPLLSPSEARQLLVEWTATAAPYPRERGLHQLFADQAAETPAAIALIAGDHRLSYGELARRVLGLARVLGERGVGPEVPVAILAERTPEMVIALLAVLAAGGAYVPLDPAYPAERLAFLLADCAAPVLLAQEHLAGRVPTAGTEVLLLADPGGSGPARGVAGPASRPCHPEQAAYVIYTSGSTGRPKGVVVRQASAAARVTWAVRHYSPEELAGVLASTSICFDLSVFEIFVPLAAGGTVILADNALALPGLPAADAVTLVNTVPSAAAELVRAGSLPASVRIVNLAGEPLRRELVDRLHELPSGVAVHNLYGPTEDTIYSTGARMERGDLRSPSLGRPLPNSRAYLLDGGMQPVPVGTAGELWLGGEGLARGYLERPDLTADRFRPDPFAAEPGRRLYRTGDAARWRPAGDLDYLGRLDHQVKVRGYRVELGEVEAALGQFPGLAEVAVAVHEGEPGGSRLSAYVVPVSGVDLLPAALHEWTAVRLPGYMVPSAWTFLAALPRTPNGKLDRRVLLPPRPSPTLPAGGAAPRTLAEELLAEIWAQLLGRERVDAHDHFFELGGHSLLAAQIVSRVRESLGVDLPVRTLFERSTFAAFAGGVEQALRTAPAPVVPLSSAPREGEIPLSFAQERLWFLDQLDPGTAFYNIPVAARLHGPLDLPVLSECFAATVRRHESLRTTFADHGGRPCQVIAASSPAAAVPLVDLSALPAAEREAEAEGQLQAEVRRPFDLARGPLLRVLLFRLAGSDHLLVPTFHHIVSDGWSLTILLRDLASLYEAGLRGLPSPLAPLSVQYADYAVWQRRALAGDVLAAHLAYWREQLARAPGLELPIDRPRPAVETFRGAQHRLTLPAEVVASLVDLSRREGVTLFMTLLAAFQVLLLRTTGQEDVAIGAPIAHRSRPEFEPLIGFFANTLVLRTGLGDNPAFRELLGRVREVALGAYAHEELPFEKLVEEIQPERDTSHNPLFQVMCVLQNQSWPDFRMGELALVPLEVDSGTAKFDLTLFWREQQGVLRGLLEYNSDLFDGVTARRLYRHFETLLGAALAAPETRLADLPLLDEAGRHQLLFAWNEAGEEWAGRCVHAWVEEQVTATPERVATVHGGQSLTYAELNRRANRLAHGLRGLGVGPEVLVGICLERSLEMTVAMLAVLKAGGATVALDPAYPTERLAFIVEDALLPVLLTETRLLDRFPRHLAIAVCLGPGAEPFPEASAGNPESGVTLDHPMYAIYTSGSTGQPKGILVTHHAFSNLLAWQFGSSGLTAGARTLQFATFGFCVSFQEVFSSWCAGGELVLADEMTRRNIDGLGEFLDRYGVERLHLPAAALKHLAEAAVGRDRLPPRLREVITAGEQLQVTAAVRDLFSRLSGCALHNQYGASETHVVSALALTGDPRGWPAIPTVGRPIGNVRIHLLDGGLRPAPVGVAGQLYAGGACTPRCYLNDPVLTAAKLVPDPYSTLPGARLYRTGDAAHYLADGRIQYRGRMDGQVKIRGFRVELGEVETVLRQFPAIRDAAVVVHADGGGAVRLVSYVVAKGEDLSSEDLLSFLKSKLPEYMLPAAFIPLPVLPINANGKLDREALPAPAALLTGRQRPFVAPRSPVEELLAELWGRVLGLSKVGIHDDFFASGGHSLLATQLISRIRATFQVDVPLRTLFEAPTVADMARALAAHEARPGHCAEIAQLVQGIKAMSSETLRLELDSRKAGGALL